MNLRMGDWDGAMVSFLGVPPQMHPRIVHSCGVLTTTDGDVARAEVPIAGITGDQQAALFGQACSRPGRVKNTYGTGCFALMHTGERSSPSRHWLLSTTAASSAGKIDFALEGAIFVAGAVVQWLRDELGLIATETKSQQDAESDSDTAGVYLVPAFTGLGAPYWDAEVRWAARQTVRRRIGRVRCRGPASPRYSRWPCRRAPEQSNAEITAAYTRTRG